MVRKSIAMMALTVVLHAHACLAEDIIVEIRPAPRTPGEAIQRAIIDADTKRRNNPEAIRKRMDQIETRKKSLERSLAEQDALSVECGKNLAARKWHITEKSIATPHPLGIPKDLNPIRAKMVRVSPLYVWMEIDLKWLQRNHHDMAGIRFSTTTRVEPVRRLDLPMAEQKIIWSHANAALDKEPEIKQRWPQSALKSPSANR